MSRLNTSVTKLLGIKVPLLSAPMAGAAGAKLATAVTRAGGFGLIGTASPTPKSLRSELELVPKDVQYGVGFIGWLLDSSEETRRSLTEALAVDHPPKAIWLSFGNDLQKYLRQIQAWNQSESASKILTMIQVNSVDEARRVAEWGVDILIAQGIESGGHGHGSAPPAMSLLEQVLVARIPECPPVLAAGGFTSGKQLAEVIKAGGAGIVVGTGFLCTPESQYGEHQKAAIIDASSSDAVRSMAFDEVRNTLGWPLGVDGRGLRNAIVTDQEAGLSLEERKARFMAKGGDKSNKDGMIVWAGTGVGSIKRIRPAADIVEEIYSDALASVD